MNSIPSAPSPLIGDPARQAIDSLRGYDYQIWRSVEAWMMLAEGQTLYLECAEDFDILGESEAETFQIKNSGKNITLASSDVCEAIENFWLLLERNLNRTSITMRFQTRGGIGAEKGQPFDGEKGIEVWRKAAAGDTEAALRLARHLSERLKTPSLTAFLKSANAEELRERLFRRIVWATGEPGIEAVRLAVERMAIRLGNARDIGAKECLSAVDGLLAHCRHAATRNEPELRTLTVEDKIRVFEDKTSLRVPATRGALAILGRALFSPGTPATGNTEAIVFAPATLGIEPALPPFVLPRTSFVDRIIEQRSPALIVGSEGRGKTTVASLVAQRLGGVDWWADLSAVDASSLSAALDRLLLELRSSNAGQIVVLDDFPVGSAIAQGVWLRFNAIIEECARRPHFLAFTAKGVDPSAIDHRLRLAEIAIHSVPDLSVTEIEDFTTTLGCPDESRARWATAILGQSGGGHPKLVHLLGLELRDRGWVEPADGFWTQPPSSIEEAKAFARKEAARTLPEEDRELLYALSLAFYPLDRKDLLSLGGKIANSRSPGDSLDRLVGRWVETRGAKRYLATALLAGQANFAWPDGRVEEAHACLFDTLIGHKSISVDQAFPIFLHAWHSGDEARLGGYLATLAIERDKLRGNLAEHLAPAMFVARGNDATTNARFSARTLALLKTVQFRIARQQNPAQLIGLASEWSDAIARIPDKKMREENRMLWAISIADSPERIFPARMLVIAFEEIDRLETIAPKGTFNEGISAEMSPSGVIENSDMVAVLFGFNFVRCEDLDYVCELFDALEKAAPSARTRMLKAFDIPFFKKSHLFVEGPWINEAKREQPRWTLAEETLRRMLALAGEWQCRNLAVPVTRILSTLYDGHLDRHDDALACLKDTAARFGESPVLVAQEATVLFNRDEYKNALELWKKSLWRPSIQYSEGERNPQALRKAGVAAGKLRAFGAASEWFEYAATSARDLHMPAIAGGALFDGAFCAFKDGSFVRAVSLAQAGLSAFEKDFDPAEQFDLFAAKKLGGHVLLWMLEQIRGRFGEEPAAEPVLGQCSNPGRSKEIAQLPAVPSDLSAALLVEIASLLNVNSADIDRLRTRLEATKLAIASHQYWSLRCNEAMASGQFKDIGPCLLRLQRAVWHSIAQRRKGINPLLPFSGDVEEADRALPLGAEAVLVTALLLHALAGGTPNALAEHWIASFQGQPDSSQMIAEARKALEVISVDAATALKLSSDREATALARLGAVCRLLIERNGTPEATAQCQWIVLFRLRITLGRLTFYGMLPLLAKVFASLWRDHLAVPALLLSPRVSVPLIKDAVDNDLNPPQQLLNLLSAAQSATGVAAQQDLIDELRAASKTYAARVPW